MDLLGEIGQGLVALAVWGLAWLVSVFLAGMVFYGFLWLLRPGKPPREETVLKLALAAGTLFFLLGLLSYVRYRWLEGS